MTQAVRKRAPENQKIQRLSVVPAPATRDFILRVEGEYAVTVEAESIEDAMALAQADEWSERRNARLVEVGDQDNQLSFEVGR